jgi:hypothetical protein
MSVTYRISHLMSPIDGSICPPPFLEVVFPAFDGSQSCWFAESENGLALFVTFDTPQTPVDLGPLVKIETVPNP